MAKKRSAPTAGQRMAVPDPAQKKLRIIFNLLLSLTETLHGSSPGNKRISNSYRKLWSDLENEERTAQR
jgi:hypothetical protein